MLTIVNYSDEIVESNAWCKADRKGGRGNEEARECRTLHFRFQIHKDSVRRNLASLKAIEIRKVSKNVAKKEILTYMERHKEAYASDISEELGLDIDVVFSIMKELRDKGAVE